MPRPWQWWSWTRARRLWGWLAAYAWLASCMANLGNGGARILAARPPAPLFPGSAWVLLSGLAVGIVVSPLSAVLQPYRWIAYAVFQWSFLWDRRPGAALLLVAAGVGAWHLARRPHGAAVVLGHLPVGWPLRLALEDRFLHTHVLGPTGSGKSSSILAPCIRQDLIQGHGVILLEPKGDLSATAADLARAAGRTLVVFDPRHAECPHFNPLDGPAEQSAEGLAWALDQLSQAGHPFYATISRVQLVYSVRAIKAAWHEAADIGTLLRFLRDIDFRDQTLAQVTDPALIHYFRDQLGALSARTANEQRQGLLNRLELLWSHPQLRRVLSAPGDFAWDQVLAEGHVVVAPLSLAELGAGARALGILLWHTLAMAVYRRTAEGPPAFLYMDEFHQYVTPDFADFLALARGYRVGLVIAHQDMGQLSPTLTQAVLGNARQRIWCGGLPPADVELFQKAAAPYGAFAHFRYLPRGQALAHCTRGGRLTPPRRIVLAHLPLAPLSGPQVDHAG